MRKFLIISHGGLAKGMSHTLTLFLGENHPFHAISAYMDESNVDDVIADFVSSLDESDELVVFSDLNGGSVNQKMIPYLSRPNTHIIAGFNFPLLLNASFYPMDETLTEQVIEGWIQEAQSGILYVNTALNSFAMSEDDE